MRDLLDINAIETLNQEETDTINQNLAESVEEEIQLFIQQIKEDDDVKSCRCCVKFPTKQLHQLK